jgi:homoserine O-acetyltransferase
MIGPGAPMDTDHYFVICLNSLGSCKGSTGPASINPETGRPWRLDFPELTVEDIAASASLLLRQLGIEQLCILAGPSMGGMTSLAWLRQNPKGARHFITISSSPKAEPFSIAVRSLQREMIVTDTNWNDGQYEEGSYPENGMRMARKLGMLSYRSAEEWRARFGRQPQDYFEPEVFGMNFSVESYLEAAARRFIGSFDPCSYIYLSRSMDWFDAGDGYPTLAAALSEVQLESAFVMGVETDILFPLHQQKEIASALSENHIQTGFSEVPSIMGHDAFLVDYHHFNPQVAAYFKRVLAAERDRD